MFAQVVLMLREISFSLLSCPKLVSECQAELHVTLKKHHNETHAMKMTNHNSKTACPNVEIEEY